MKKSVYIIDDNNEFRKSTTWWLEAENYQVKSFENPNTALEYLSKQKSAKNCCILMDVRMPSMSGLDLHDRLNRNEINIPIIYMTGHASINIAVEAMKKGAVTYLEKPLDDKALQTALTTAFEQKNKEMIANHKMNDENAAQQTFQQRYSSLTPREMEVMQGIVDGKMNKIIAYDLGISIKTIEIHRAQVKKKMKAKSAADLVKMALTKEAI